MVRSADDLPVKHQPALSFSPADIDRNDLLLIVVGAHLSAEKYDRATAEGLRGEIARRLATSSGGRPESPMPLVCTDLWYLNDPSLRDCPVISIGGPEVNALTAYLADKLPSALAIDEVLIVQMDVELGDSSVLAACWGADHTQTARAVDLFIQKYLGRFLVAAARD